MVRPDRTGKSSTFRLVCHTHNIIMLGVSTSVCVVDWAVLPSLMTGYQNIPVPSRLFCSIDKNAVCIDEYLAQNCTVQCQELVIQCHKTHKNEEIKSLAPSIDGTRPKRKNYPSVNGTTHTQSFAFSLTVPSITTQGGLTILAFRYL